MSCFIVSSGGRTEIALIRLIVAKSELKEEVLRVLTSNRLKGRMTSVLMLTKCSLHRG